MSNKASNPFKSLVIRSILTGLFIVTAALSPVRASDVLKVEKLSENVYALIGPLTNRNPQNLGNNANFGVIITSMGVVLVDSGATYKGAQMIHNAIKSITNKSVKVVINSGGQDHRWLGNGYFKSQGATIIASEKAVLDQKTRTQDQLISLANLVGVTELDGTEPVYADETFKDNKTLKLGDTHIEIMYRGQAHTPGDSFIWLPDQKIVFSGDIVYTDRLLGIGSQSAHASWISVFEAMAQLKPEVVVGGHGMPASLSKARADTYDYLVTLRQSVQQFMDEENGIEDIHEVDQSQFKYLANFKALKGRNAQRVYEELEWE